LPSSSRDKGQRLSVDATHGAPAVGAAVHDVPEEDDPRLLSAALRIRGYEGEQGPEEVSTSRTSPMA
jgi:hypothetical protein